MVTDRFYTTYKIVHGTMPRVNLTAILNLTNITQRVYKYLVLYKDMTILWLHRKHFMTLLCEYSTKQKPVTWSDFLYGYFDDILLSIWGYLFYFYYVMSWFLSMKFTKFLLRRKQQKSLSHVLYAEQVQWILLFIDFVIVLNVCIFIDGELIEDNMLLSVCLHACRLLSVLILVTMIALSTYIILCK